MPGHYTKILGRPACHCTARPHEGLELLTSAGNSASERVEVVNKASRPPIYGPSAIGGIARERDLGAPTSPSEVLVNGSTREASDVALLPEITPSLRGGSASLVAGRH
jgi:hypothetical protein